MMQETVRGPERRPTPNPEQHRSALERLLQSCSQQLSDSADGKISTHTATEFAFAQLQRVQNTDLVLPLEALGDVGLSALGLRLGQLGLAGHNVSFRILDAEMMSDSESSDGGCSGEESGDDGDHTGPDEGEGGHSDPRGGAYPGDGSEASDEEYISSVGGSIEEMEAIFRLLGGEGGVSQDIAGGGLARPRRRARLPPSSDQQRLSRRTRQQSSHPAPAAAAGGGSSGGSGGVASRTRGAAASRAAARRPIRRARGSGRAAAGVTRATSNAQSSSSGRSQRSRGDRRRR